MHGLLITEAKEAANLWCTCHHNADSPVGSSWDVSHGSGHGSYVRRDKLRWKLLKLYNALGYIYNGFDKVVNCIKPGFQRVGMFYYIRQLLKECDRLGKVVSSTELSNEPELSIVHSKGCMGNHHFCIPWIVWKHVEYHHSCCMSISSTGALAGQLPIQSSNNNYGKVLVITFMTM